MRLFLAILAAALGLLALAAPVAAPEGALPGKPVAGH